MARAAARFKLTAPVIREPILHKQIADALRLELCAPGRISKDGVVWWSQDISSYHGTAPGIRTGRGVIAGVPDLIVLHAGRAFLMELKAEDGVVSDAQRVVGASIIFAGCHFGVVRSIQEVLQHLDAWGIPRQHRLHGA
jgi:hypothetical protein